MMNKIKFIFFIINLSQGSFIFSQQTAMFEMPIYFRDAVGNSDTIIIGGDTTAVQGLNPQFGEIPIALPFDSIFEIRATDFDGITLEKNPILTKKVIGWTEEVLGSEEDCDLIESIFFIASAKYLPIKVYWDSLFFRDSFCISESYISTSKGAWMLGEWVFGDPYFDPFYCMASFDSISLDSNPDFSTWVFDFEYEIEGKGLDSLFVFYLTFSLPGLNGPCDEIVATNEIINHIQNVALYPNPSSDNITIVWPDFGKGIQSIEIYDFFGNRITNYQIDQSTNGIKTKQISVKDYPSGIYIAIIHSQNELAIKKFIKI